MISAIAPKGGVLAFEAVARPVVALKGGKTRGLALDRLLYEGGEEKPASQGLARLSAYDVEQVDRTLLQEGFASVTTVPCAGRTPLLFAPAAFSTLASPRGRRDVIELVREAQSRLRARFVLEITHLDAGLPPSRLVEVLALLRPTCKVVFARLKPERRAIMALTDCSLAGAAIEAVHIKDPEDEDTLTRVRLVMRAVGPRMLLHNLRSTAAIHAAHAAGIGYASLDLSQMRGEVPRKENGDRETPAAA